WVKGNVDYVVGYVLLFHIFLNVLLLYCVINQNEKIPPSNLPNFLTPSTTHSPAFTKGYSRLNPSASSLASLSYLLCIFSTPSLSSLSCWSLIFAISFSFSSLSLFLSASLSSFSLYLSSFIFSRSLFISSSLSFFSLSLSAWSCSLIFFISSSYFFLSFLSSSSFSLRICSSFSFRILCFFSSTTLSASWNISLV
uniref:Uncharacterized protein n=1 Tax=Gasterosteus aculeatus TaxID=69293 RepID=G3NRN2_GASAC